MNNNIIRLRNKGLSIRKIAKELGLNREKVRRSLKVTQTDTQSDTLLTQMMDFTTETDTKVTQTDTKVTQSDTNTADTKELINKINVLTQKVTHFDTLLTQTDTKINDLTTEIDTKVTQSDTLNEILPVIKDEIRQLLAENVVSVTKEDIEEYKNELLDEVMRVKSVQNMIIKDINHINKTFYIQNKAYNSPCGALLHSMEQKQ